MRVTSANKQAELMAGKRDTLKVITDRANMFHSKRASAGHIECVESSDLQRMLGMQVEQPMTVPISPVASPQKRLMQARELNAIACAQQIAHPVQERQAEETTAATKLSTGQVKELKSAAKAMRKRAAGYANQAKSQSVMQMTPSRSQEQERAAHQVYTFYNGGEEQA